MKFPLALVPANTKIDFIGKRHIIFMFSIAITIAVMFALGIKGLNRGIDFTGGVIIEFQTATSMDIKTLREKIYNAGYHSASLQNMLGENIIMLRTQLMGEHDTTNHIKSTLQSIIPDITFRKVEFVGPKVGAELIQKGLYATILSLLVMMIYIGFRFNWQFGTCAILSLLHDAIATLGFYAMTGYEFDLTSIAAILTVIGYSINDTVVIYDRIRDNLVKHKKMNMPSLVNLSINETLSRTTMTVLTTVVVCIALVAFGGQAIHSFSATVLFGIIFGTYSSICISAPLLLYVKIR